MIQETYTLTIYDCPKSNNAGGGGSRVHWGQAHKEKLRWDGQFALELIAAKVPRHMQFCHVRVTVEWKRNYGAESHNYFQAIYKPLLDALKKGGWLEDDSDEWVGVDPIKFEYPDTWDHRLARAKMIIELEASYA